MIITCCLWFLAGGEVAAQCNWDAEATANITAHDGGVVSDHRAVLTRVDCINSRKIILRANTLQNGLLYWDHDKVGGDAILGASVFYSIGFPACAGAWNSTTRAGTTYLGLNSWYDHDISGFAYPYCTDGGGGGGEDPGPCSEGTTTTATWTLAGGEAPMKSARQTGYGLWRAVERPEGSFLMDEWAVVSWKGGDPELKFASTDEFKRRIRQSISSYHPEAKSSDTVLVVEANNHPRNSRFIPTPTFLPVEIEVDWTHRSRSKELWFRAEVSEAEEVDRLTILDSSDSLGISTVRKALEENLELRYVDSRRHRVVIFGVARVDRPGRLNVRDALVVLPQCCCGTTDDIFCV